MSRPPPRAWRGLVAGLALLGAGCPSEDQHARSEAAAVSRAVDALRAADNDHKAAPLAALRAVPCSVAEVCALQSYCVAAYEQHVRALELIEAAKAEASAAPPAVLARALASAQAALEAAKQQTDGCATRQGELVRRLKVAR